MFAEAKGRFHPKNGDPGVGLQKDGDAPCLVLSREFGDRDGATGDHLPANRRQPRAPIGERRKQARPAGAEVKSGIWELTDPGSGATVIRIPFAQKRLDQKRLVLHFRLDGDEGRVGGRLEIAPRVEPP